MDIESTQKLVGATEAFLKNSSAKGLLTEDHLQILKQALFITDDQALLALQDVLPVNREKIEFQQEISKIQQQILEQALSVLRKTWQEGKLTLDHIRIIRALLSHPKGAEALKKAQQILGIQQQEAPPQQLEEPVREPRRTDLNRTHLLLIIALLLLLGGGYATVSASSSKGKTPAASSQDDRVRIGDRFRREPLEISRENVQRILQDLNYKNISKLNMQNLEQYFQQLQTAVARGLITQEDIIQSIIPDTDYALGLFYSDAYYRKLPQLISRYKPGTLSHQKYQDLNKASRVAKQHYKKHETVFEMYMRFFGKHIDQSATAYIFGDKNIGGIPSQTSLKSAHPGALDVFFTPTRVEKGIEEGPNVHAVSSGIVIAVGDNYEGKTAETYNGKGLSPKAGNGVVTFNPQTREYQYYAHLFKTKVRLGDLIKAGDVLGTGGNSGYEARRPGRGRHVHWEVHKDGKAVDSRILQTSISREKSKTTRVA